MSNLLYTIEQNSSDEFDESRNYGRKEIYILICEFFGLE